MEMKLIHAVILIITPESNQISKVLSIASYVGPESLVNLSMARFFFIFSFGLDKWAETRRQYRPEEQQE